ncbi:MAG: 23S rRNA (guanosine(2251)-2'-O)-methyltransferase RlmB [Parvibaculum sp.]|uniref:23S rRNA (guanosine(2251)-2'-O)-methyltransferase RlmB n=1 Tax=Parvibaculum sp. TaxID=2024848 RepID=UPI0025E54EDC|nr:23S rRNA (guanosine(2251)-2'-O)-methyltransferase RlmB [Parvibaculum sp.]MCE9649552.1 23S rRNA (guanosine(2251)-2'-O)-methyltransferase RlmB [Parvibaculum sp.]
MSKRKATPPHHRRPEPSRGGGGQQASRHRQHGPLKGHKGGADESFLYGFHAVIAALRNPARKPLRLVMTRNAEGELAGEGLSLGHDLLVTPEILTGEEIAGILPPGAVHQGVALKVSALPDLSVDEACEGAEVAVVLDQVTDPHNFGAILRSAAVFGAGALITTDRNSPPLGGVLAKAASGALEKVKVAKVTNLVRAIEELKELGFEVIGLDGEGDASLPDFKTGPKVALVLGAEGAGLRRLTREHCDILARLPASGDMKSLNVSNAAAVALYELSRRR